MFSVIHLEAILSSARQWVTHTLPWSNTILPGSTKYFIYMKGAWCQEMLCGRWQYVQGSHTPFLWSWREGGLSPTLGSNFLAQKKGCFPLSGLVATLFCFYTGSHFTATRNQDEPLRKSQVIHSPEMSGVLSSTRLLSPAHSLRTSYQHLPFLLPFLLTHLLSSGLSPSQYLRLPQGAQQSLIISLFGSLLPQKPCL